MALGEFTLQEWYADEGWGVLSSSATPGGCWFLFDTIQGHNPDSMTVGNAYCVDYESAEQDGYHFRATWVWPSGEDRQADIVTQSSSGSFGSLLKLD